MNTSKIQIPNIEFSSDLNTIIFELENIKARQLIDAIPKHIFIQLKEIFYILETLGSAKIEGNNTTLSEYIEKIIEKNDIKDEQQIEIKNIEKALEFIENNTNEKTQFNRAYISQLHKIIMQNLTPPPNGEGSNYPGILRKHNVSIKKAKHNPPEFCVLQEYFDEFIRFINSDHKKQYQLLMIAIAHHRFAYIHPFDNGNGRLGRLINYALLIKLGFKLEGDRIINPSSVFYSNRNKYYDKLAQADSLKDKDVLDWCYYFLSGLKNEIRKIDVLLDKKYVKEKILLPSINFALDRENITAKEYKILKYIINKEDMFMKSQELDFLGLYNSKQKARLMAKLKDKKLVFPITKGGRIYSIKFTNNYLLRGVMTILKKEGFIHDFLK